MESRNRKKLKGHFKLTLLLTLFLLITCLNMGFIVSNTYANSLSNIETSEDAGNIAGENFNNWGTPYKFDISVLEEIKANAKDIFTSTAPTVTATIANDYSTSGKSYYTVLYSNGTLVINETASKVSSSTTSITAKWDPLDSTKTYVFWQYYQVLWYDYRSQITSVKFGSTVKPVNMNYWFYGCSNLATFSSTNLDTSNVNGMSYTFYGAGSNSTITTISLDISGWDTSKVTDMSYMFYNAWDYVTTFSLPISSWNTSTVTTMSHMFESAGSNVTTFSLPISSWNTSSVTDMSSMFAYSGEYAKTYSIDLSKWNTGKVKSMYSMFQYSGSNIYVSPTNSWSVGDLSKWDTSSVTSMTSMFYGAGSHSTSWSVGDLSNWNTSKVSSMSGMFHSAGADVTGTFSLNLSGWNTSSVTSMRDMFSAAGYDASNFVLNLSNWDTSSVTNMSEMFFRVGYSATSWSIVGLSNFNTGKVTDMSDMFEDAGYNATTLSLDLSSWNTGKVTNMYRMFWCVGFYSTNLSLDLTGWDTSNVTNMENMFFDAGMYSPNWSVVGLSSWDTSAVTNMQNMFTNAGYKATTFNLDLSGWDVREVTTMCSDYLGMFEDAGHSATTFNLDLSGWNVRKVTSLRAMFSGAGEEATTFNLNLSNWKAPNVTDMSSMFYRVGYNASEFILDMSNCKLGAATDMKCMFQYAFYYATSASLDLSNWNTGTVTDMSYMFNHAGYKAKSVSLDISNWDTSKVTNMNGMFDYFASYTKTATDIGSFTIPSGASMTYFARYACTLSAEITVLASSSYGDAFYYAATKLDDDDNYISEITLIPADTDATTAANKIIQLWGLSGTSSKGNIHLPKTFSTVLYSDGTLVINQPDEEIDQRKSSTGTTVIAQYDPLDSKNTYVFTTYTEVLWYEDRDSIASVKFGSTEGTTSKIVQPTSMAYWFYDCQNLYTFNSTNLDTSSVADISYMFSKAGSNSKITTFNLDISGWNTDSVTNMSHMFEGAGSSVKALNINLSKWDTSNVKDMSYMLCNFASGTTSATNIGSFTIPSGANIDGFAKNAKTLSAEITISGGVSSYANAFNAAATKKDVNDKYISEIKLMKTEVQSAKEVIDNIISLYGLTGSASQGNIVVKDINATGTTGSIVPLGNVGKVDGDKISFENLTLQWQEANKDVGITQEGWNYGFRIKVPEVVNSTTLPRIKYSTSSDGTLTESFTNHGTADDCYMDFWIPITASDIEEALERTGIISGALRFDWEGDGKVDQTFTYSVDVSNITLLGEAKDGNGNRDTEFKVENGIIKVKDGEDLDYSGKLSAITKGGTVSGDEIIFSNLELKYGEGSGNNDDGWWIGVKITASPDLDIEKATYSITETGKTDLSFADNKTGKDDNGNTYMDCWIKITPEDIEKALEGTGQLTQTYVFDWTGDGSFEQELKIIIDASKIILLDKDGDIEFKTVDGVVTVRDKVSVDYSAVEEALKKVPEDLTGYTEESVAALEKVIEELDYKKSVDEQDEVDEMAKKLEEAIAALEKKADYSKVDEAMKKVPTDLSYYTEETAKALQEAIDAVVRGLPATEQSKVDKMAEKLEAALKLLDEKPKADYSKVDEALEKVPEDLSGYTEETAKELQEIIDSLIKDLPEDRQEEVDEMAKKLEEAIEALEKKADYTAVEEALKKVPTDLSYYTEESVAALKELLDSLDYDKSVSDQAYVDEMAKKIEEAIKKLEEKPKADYSKVDEALEKVPEDLSGYTEETAKELQEIIDSLIKDLPEDRQDEVDEMAKKLEEAIEALEKKADYSSVDEALKKVPSDLSYYTEETAKALQAAIDAVVRGLPETEQSKVDKMAKKLEEAIKKLEEKPKADYSKVDEALEKVPEDLSGYTEETAKELQEIIDSLIKDLPEDRQDEVDEMAKKLEEAIEGLEEKTPEEKIKADYSAVEEALKQVPNDLSGYTEETAEALKKVIESLDYSKSADEQDEVDLMAERIEAAIKALSPIKVDDTSGAKTVITRYSGSNRYLTAQAIADGLLNRLTTKFDTIIIASGVGYADALAGSYLSYVNGNAPIILVNSANEALVKAYITKNLNIGGKVYILGGTGVVSQAFETSITKLGSFTVKRLAGQNRYLTNIEILKEANVDKSYTGELLICTGTNYADSLSASAVDLPMLLVGDKLLDLQKTYLATIGSQEVVILGGTGAVSASLASSLGKTIKSRLAGANRYETSVMVADTFFGEKANGQAVTNISLAYGLDFPDGLAGGPLARAIAAPLLLVANTNETSYKYAIEYIKDKTLENCIVFGGTGVISDALVTKVLS